MDINHEQRHRHNQATMTLAAIFIVWKDTIELLPFALDSMPADAKIVVWSNSSNHGEIDTEYILSAREQAQDKDNIFSQFEPNMRLSLAENETAKRNHGLEIAKKLNCSHFIMCDADEFYKSDQLNLVKEGIEDLDINGVVHPIKVYVRKPTLWCDDHTLVPGIQKLYPNTELGIFKRYPFAYDKEGNAHIDPTRRTNCTHGIEMSPYYMHHMSYVRRDIDLKIRNSSANLRRSEDKIKRDIANAAPGYMSELYHQELKECTNYFNIKI